MLTLFAVVHLTSPIRHTCKQTLTIVVKIILVSFFCIASYGLRAQRVDSIFFNLYTDSLKKGTHNYINVDGKMSNGRWLPLTSKEIQFSSSDCKFSGNELIVPLDCTADKITIKAVLKSNPALWLERTIWIKKKPDGELPTKDEILRDMNNKQKRRRN